MSQLIRTSVLTIQENKGSARIWIEGLYLRKAGFAENTQIRIRFMNDKIIINSDVKGNRKVSTKRSHPVIDVNNKKILQVFKVSEKVRLIAEVGKLILTKTKKEIRKLMQLKDKSCGSVFSGGGLMDEAAKKAGFKTKWAIEYNPKYADIWQLNHEGVMHNSDISDVILDDLDQVELLIAGIPCEPFSVARKDGVSIEEHKSADLSMFFLMIVEKVNPRIIVLEEVQPYAKSPMGIMTMAALERMGYKISRQTVSGPMYGEIEKRKRCVIVATMHDGITFPEEIESEKTMAEVLMSKSDPRCEWFDRNTQKWVFDCWEKQKAKGNYFFSQLITKDSQTIQAITKRYLAKQPGSPVVKHPTEDLYRWLSIDEIKKLKTLNLGYKLAYGKIVSGEVLGQGVIVKIFARIIKHVREQVGGMT